MITLTSKNQSNICIVAHIMNWVDLNPNE